MSTPAWITEAAQAWIVYEAAVVRAKEQGHYSANGSPEHMEYAKTVNRAYVGEGLPLEGLDSSGRTLTPQTHWLLHVYGTEQERGRVRAKIVQAVRESTGEGERG